jgi:putative tricarboxylic transport membrane protein
MKKGEIIASAACVLFFSFMLFQACELLGEGRVGEVGSGFWPVMSLAACLFFSLIWLITTVIGSKKNRGIPAAVLKPVDAAAVWERRKKVGLSILSLFLYIVAMPWIGFILSTFLFVFAFAVSLGERRKFILAVSPFLVTSLVIIVFAKFITIPFPKGAGVFAAFSRLFY